MFSHTKRVAAATFAGVMAFSMVAPGFVQEASAAPMAISTALSNDSSVQGANLPVTDVRYRRYGRRGGNGGAAVLGILGLGLGIAALSAQNRRYRDYDGYDDGYYGQPAYGYGGGYSYGGGYGGYGYRRHTGYGYGGGYGGYGHHYAPRPAYYNNPQVIYQGGGHGYGGGYHYNR